MDEACANFQIVYFWQWVHFFSEIGWISKKVIIQTILDVGWEVLYFEEAGQLGKWHKSDIFTVD